MTTVLTYVSGISFLLFVGCGAAAIIGIYISIWGNSEFGGRIVATALVTAVLMMGVGIPTHSYLKSKDTENVDK